MFDFFRIRTKLNKNDKKVSKAVDKALSAVQDLTKVNNSLVTVDADASAKATQYNAISESVKSKMETNQAMIDTLKQVVSK